MTQPNEQKRLAAVRSTKIFGSAAEERFDRITRIAQRLFSVDMAFIDLVGEDTIWVKSVQGMDIFEAEKRFGYCAITVQQEGVCLIEDARVDTRLVGNPYINYCIFYAGVPLKFSGENVGSLCISHTAPRSMTESELDDLRDLAVLVERELEIVAMFEIQTALTVANGELETRAVTDILTRCWNRAGIFEIASRELKNVRNTSCGFALIDIDHFKKINDNFGHPAGDEVLRVVAQRLRAASRPTDAIGRYGGEEFLAVLPSVDQGSIKGVCERLRLAVSSEPVTYQGHQISVTCSVGGALSRDTHMDELIEEADRQLYRAKRQGRNRTEIAPRRE